MASKSSARKHGARKKMSDTRIGLNQIDRATALVRDRKQEYHWPDKLPVRTMEFKSDVVTKVRHALQSSYDWIVQMQAMIVGSGIDACSDCIDLLETDEYAVYDWTDPKERDYPCAMCGCVTELWHVSEDDMHPAIVAEIEQQRQMNNGENQ